MNCMLLLLAEVLAPVNKKFIQTSTLIQLLDLKNFVRKVL